MQSPGGAREILALSPEHSWADHSVPGVLWGKVRAPLSPMLPAAAEGKGPRGSQLAGADGGLQFVGQGGENLVKLLVAPGLAAADALAAPEQAHLELSAEHLQELGPGLEPCREGRGGGGVRGRPPSWGAGALRATASRWAPLGDTFPSSARDSARCIDKHGHTL